jgi:Fe2+ or Zn2+ uptake regulation protein
LPCPEQLVPAIRDHDEGWRDWERLPDIEPETLWPRNFTEMPPEESARIWSHSIETCRRGRQSIVASVDEFRWFLALAGMRLTHERAIIAEEVFSSREAFSADDLLARLPQRDDGRRVSRSSVYRTLALMEEARLLRKVSLGTYRDAYEQTRKIGGGSALGGIWVSKHFTFLAERAGHGQSGETHPFAGFLAEQRRLQKQWTAEITREHGPAEASLLIEAGYRWVQVFDRFSLWLCCRERTATEAFELPGGETVHFTPLKSGEIAVEPYPFSVPALELEVDAKRLSKKTFRMRAAFHAALEQAKRERIKWQLVRW